jgi:spore germination protein
MTANQPDIGREKAKAAAATFLGTQPSSLADSGDTGGTLPTYNFTTGTISINVAKNGGFIVRMIDSRTPGETKLDKDAAIKAASDFLNSRGIHNMSQTYYLQGNNMSTINFAYQLSGVTCYPDLIKVGVGLDNGSLISFDATGYLMNHISRSIPTAKVAESAISAKLNPHLKVNKVGTVIIPTDGGGEATCYEYKCTGDGGQTVIDYFNTQTGVEQQVLILLDTPGGTLPL